jgi:hypothetical protein
VIVEAVQDSAAAAGNVGKRVLNGPVFYMRGRLESGGSRGLGGDFHFSQPPAVTAGFHGFAFDIRKKQK